MQAKDIMQQNLISVVVDTKVEDIAKLMIEHKISGVPVVNDIGTVLGVVSEADIMRTQIEPKEPSLWELLLWEMNDNGKLETHRDSLRRYWAKTAAEMMTSPAVTVDELEDVDTVGRIMFARRIKRVFVTKQDALVGVISRSDFVRLMINAK